MKPPFPIAVDVGLLFCGFCLLHVDCDLMAIRMVGRCRQAKLRSEFVKIKILAQISIFSVY
jgi:hypothetical protein